MSTLSASLQSFGFVSRRGGIQARASAPYILPSSRASTGALRCVHKSGLSCLCSWEAWSTTVCRRRFYGRMSSRGSRRYASPGSRSLVMASLFGVGAPEVLVIAVVALLVFGPKGLAEVAKSLGQSLRAFQPTIREIQEVSREFKQTLEKEIGLDELKSQTYNQQKMPEKPSQPVNENFVIEELTAQLELLQAQKASASESGKAEPANPSVDPPAPASDSVSTPETPASEESSNQEKSSNQDEATGPALVHQETVNNVGAAKD